MLRERNRLTGCLPWLPLSASQNVRWGEKRETGSICNLFTDLRRSLDRPVSLPHTGFYTVGWDRPGPLCSTHITATDPFLSTSNDQRGECRAIILFIFCNDAEGEMKDLAQFKPKKHVFHVPWPLQSPVNLHCLFLTRLSSHWGSESCPTT